MTAVDDQIVPPMNGIARGPYQKVYAELVNNSNNVNDSSNPVSSQITGIDYVSGQSGIDSATETLQIIEYEHHEIHTGSHFSICDYDINMAVNETKEFVVTTPNTTKWAHMLLDFASSLGATLEIYEGCSSVVGGTPVTAINNNRNSATVSVLTILLEPSSITTGTRIYGFVSGGNRNSGMVSRDKELELKQNTIYLYRFTSLANSNTLSFCGEWYEHTNKN